MKRPFRGLRLSQGPEARYDAVVIGAGIGGLVCANLLARDGRRVLLLEQHYVVGGYCSTFRRRGYTFDAASHFYPLLGNASTLTGQLLDELGVEAEWIAMDPVDHFHFADGSSFSVPADFDAYIAQLKMRFPQQVQALDAFFADVRRAYMLGLLHYFRRRKVAALSEFIGLSLSQVLDRHIADPKLRLLLTADCAHWGSTPSRTSFVFDSMLRLSYFLGNYYPRGGSQVFADALAHTFEQRGGHILLNSSAQRIVVRDGRACGVKIETGPRRQRHICRVDADVVVSNGDLRQTVEKMLAPGDCDETYIKDIRRLRPTHPCYLVHLGLRDMPTEELRRIQGYYWNGWDAEELARDGMKFKLFVPTLFEPQMAPPGGHVLIVQKAVEVDYDAIEDWPEHKAGIERYIMRELENISPGIGAKCIVQMSASAQTSFRYTRNFQGAMLGWEMAPDQLGENRPDIVGPVEGLYLTGHWTRPGGGITPAIVSAMQVAEAVGVKSAASHAPVSNRLRAPTAQLSDP